MATIFTRIIAGEIPGRFVWRDARCVAFLSAHPLRSGHTLVVSRAEVDHWIDLDAELVTHLMGVAHAIGKGIARAFRPAKVGLMIAGLEVPHVHIHVVPIDSVHDLDFANQDPNPDPADMDGAAQAIRTALQDLGIRHGAD